MKVFVLQNLNSGNILGIFSNPGPAMERGKAFGLCEDTTYFVPTEKDERCRMKALNGVILEIRCYEIQG